jgi:glucokinase
MPLKKKLKSTKRTPFWIGFDLGGTKMLALVLDANFNVLGQSKKATNGSEGSANGMRRIITAIHEAMAEAKVTGADLKGIGIGCPGLVNPARGVLLDAPNLGWKNTPLRKRLGTAFKCPVAVLNDVDAGTYGEFHLGAGKGARSLLGVFPGTGLGAGFIYDGKLVRGRSISCMELGMMQLPGTGLFSDANGTVILEDLTSRLSVSAHAALGSFRGQAPELARRAATDLKEIKSKIISASLKAQDAATRQILQNSLRYLGMGVGAVVNLFAPDRIVLGGGLVEEMPRFYLQGLKTEVAKFAAPELVKGISYVKAKLGDYAVASGAVAYLRNEGGEAK